MQSSLFPQQGAAAAGGNAFLIEFKAGKCLIGSQQTATGKYLVTPDTEKRGKITLSKSPDGLVSFKWSNTLNGVAEDDRIVFPGESVFKRVNTGRQGDRVFMLKYLSGNQQLMYWMQDKSAEKDEYYCKRLNDLMANPNAVDTGLPPQDGARGNVVSPENWMNMMGLGARPPAPGATASGLDFFSVLSGGANPSLPVAASSSSAITPPAAVAAPNATELPVPPRPVLTLADLQRAMQQTASSSSSSSVAPTPPLQDILSPDDIINSGVLDDVATQQELLQHLPEGHQTTEELESTVRSPQFRQALTSLTQAVAH
jgi:hypothetical protein